ncbi:antizyme inhibitor 2 isoform X2 [Hydra vulgaris]|uniref:ornithine decarboxylase n=1 Tax=Hydra vulgaris TaxID=6087 RepID=A0ABM4D8S8_HYDVU
MMNPMNPVSQKLSNDFLSESSIDICNDNFNMKQYLRFKVNANDREYNDDPFYVCDIDDIVKKHWMFQNLLPQIKPFYAIKCNPDPVVIALLAHLEVNFDCASKCEIKAVLDLGVDPDRIMFANPCKQASYIKYANEKNVKKMTFDNEAELFKIKEHFPGAELVIRIKVDDSKSTYKLGRKFGASLKSTQKLLQIAKNLDLNVIGVSFHVGTGCYDASLFYSAVKSAAAVFNQGENLGYNFTLLDIGGGFPGVKNGKISMDNIAAQLNLSIAEFFPPEMNLSIIAEPGKYFVESAFTLCCNVTSVRKVVDDKKTEFMYYLNDGVYNSFLCVLFSEKFKPLPLNESKTHLLFKSSVWGPTCDSCDCISEETYLPKLSIGDWLYFENMGAYATCLATKFNGFNPPIVYYACTDSIYKDLSNDKANLMKCRSFKDFFVPLTLEPIVKV